MGHKTEIVITRWLYSQGGRRTFHCIMVGQPESVLVFYLFSLVVLFSFFNRRLAVILFSLMFIIPQVYVIQL